MLILVDGDDWEGVYLNDELIDEGHRITKRELVHHMQVHDTLDVRFVSLTDEGCKWLEDQGCFPRFYGAIPQDLLLQNT